MRGAPNPKPKPNPRPKDKDTANRIAVLEEQVAALKESIERREYALRASNILWPRGVGPL